MIATCAVIWLSWTARGYTRAGALWTAGGVSEVHLWPRVI